MRVMACTNIHDPSSAFPHFLTFNYSLCKEKSPNPDSNGFPIITLLVLPLHASVFNDLADLSTLLMNHKLH